MKLNATGHELSPAARISIAALGALCLASAQSPEASGGLSILGMVLWLVSIRELRLLPATGIGLFCGGLYGILNASWASEALVGFGIDEEAAWGATIIGGVFVKGVELAVESALISCAYNAHPYAKTLVAGSAIFVVETLVSSGSWSVPWGFFGHAHIENVGVAQLAVAGGVPLISGMSAVLASALASGVESPKDWRVLRIAAAAGIGWGLISAGGLPIAKALRAPNQGVHSTQRAVLAVQPQFRRDQRWADGRQIELIRSIASQTSQEIKHGVATPSVVLWPELTVTSPLDNNRAAESALRGSIRALGVPVLAGVAYSARADDPSVYRNLAVWFDRNGDFRASLEKNLAVPLIEAADPSGPARWLADGLQDEVRVPRVEEREGGGELRVDFGVAVLLCYEALFPRFASSRRSPTTEFIANLADNSWIESPSAAAQLVTAARFRAIEQRLPLIRVAHGGPSVAVDEYGLITAEIPVGRPGTLMSSVSRVPLAGLGERVCLFLIPILPVLMVRKWV